MKEKKCLSLENLSIWKKKVWTTGPTLLCATLCLACYKNSLDCGLVFDDVSAIRENRDLRPDTPWTNLLHNDFWGTPILKEQSHKSYRPVCVFTYRLNYLLHGLRPFGYHLFNVILHTAVCLLYHRLCVLLVSKRTACMAAVLFSVHPVHTEAVTGVVGRAEVLSALFYLMAFLSYVSSASKRSATDWPRMTCSLLFVALATFSKEQGITAVGVCCAYEIFVIQKVRLSEIRVLLSSGKRVPKDCLLRMSVLLSWSLLLLGLRLRVMGSQLPVFTKFDNPAAVSETPTRQLTYNYLVALNSWLLLFPHALCCDWTMGSVSRVDRWTDPRNLATAVLYLFVLLLLWSHSWTGCARYQVLVMALSLCVFPFLPASNLFFPVGFVVAERVLYAPSMGFCLLVAHGTSLLATKKSIFVWSSFVFLVLVHASKTAKRNEDWETDYALFLSGIRVNPTNAKLYNNVGHFLETQGRHSEAMEYFYTAIRVEPSDVGAHMNVGRTYNHLGMFEEAEQAFRKAKDLLPRPPFGEGYEVRVAPSHLNVFLNLANLISRNGTRLEEADLLYQEAIRMRSDYVEAYINRGDILVRLNRTKEAQTVYEKALQLDNSNADIHYNLGVVFLEQKKKEMALDEFDRALKINPKHQQALLNSAILIQETGKPHMRKTAYNRLQALLNTKDTNERVYFHLGMLTMDDKNFTLAEKWFRKAVELLLLEYRTSDDQINATYPHVYEDIKSDLKPDFRSALFNLALLLSEARRPLEALPFLQKLRNSHPDHVKGLILLGDIFINHLRNLEAAKKCYEDVLLADPANAQALHNLCVVYVEQGRMQEAEDCLRRATRLAPHENYIRQHLHIVHAKRLSRQETGVHQSGEKTYHDGEDTKNRNLNSLM